MTVILRNQAIRVSNHLTRLIAKRWGEALGFVYVTEFPKCGGTWLSRMVADALQLPFPQFSRLPLACPCVVQNHWMYSPRYRPAIYLYRDGRDVITSLYFFRVRQMTAENTLARQRTLRRQFKRLYGNRFDPEDTIGNLPKFIDCQMTRGRGTGGHTWPQHIESWHDPAGRPHVVYVSYEQLRTDCATHLQRIVEHVSQQEIDPWRIGAAVEKYSMHRMTGRKPGQEDRTSVIRKGIVGDWANHFSREAATLFDHYAGDALVALGYEKDRHWVDRYPLQPH
jgi:hypothetical protein